MILLKLLVYPTGLDRKLVSNKKVGNPNARFFPGVSAKLWFKIMTTIKIYLLLYIIFLN